MPIIGTPDPSLRQGPCSWPLLGDCPDLDTIKTDDADVHAALVASAVGFLWRWTGRVFGLCDVVLRPARRSCQHSTFDGGGVSGWTPVLVGGQWRNVTCGSCAGACDCADDTRLRLPSPVHAVSAVTIDGAVLDESAYRLDDHGTLVRHDGGSWPCCQDLTLTAGEEGTWSVAYTWGVPVPVDGQLAAGMLACQLAKAWAGANDCKLPERVQTITREGVTVGFLDPFDGLDSGRTGVWLVDAWVASVTKPAVRSAVYSPDRLGATRTT